jgi:trehalose 6-phosphate synthase/phosphatase
MVNTKFGHTIYKVMHENDLIMINDVHLMLIPSSLLNKNTNSRVGIYFHMAFPSSDVIKILPGHQEFLKSILLCDVIGFHVFQFARNFLTALKRIFGIFYEIKFKGIITLNYLGRYIIIRIMHAGIDIDYVKSIIQKKDFNVNLEKFKNLAKNKFCLVSVGNPQEASGILFKLIAYKRFLDRFPEVRNNIVLLQIIKKDFVDSKSEKYLSEINTVLNEIIADYGTEVINLMEVKKLSVPERFALFSLPCALFYLQIREGNCMVIY